MVRRLILDTGVLIAFERGKLAPEAVVRPDDDAAIATVTLTELKVGVKLAPPSKRERREAAVERALRLYALEHYTVATTEHHADLQVHCRGAGAPRGEVDLIIAATAAATNRTLVTLDRRADFGSLPGVNVIEVPTA
ncbi:MAG TPA: PIN domain-containing protein [Glycomyces sp.]|nr:PIN domain-containing protein [Glycomyces sp.]